MSSSPGAGGGGTLPSRTKYQHANPPPLQSLVNGCSSPKKGVKTALRFILDFSMAGAGA